MQRVYETERLLLKILDKNDAGIVADYCVRNRDFLEEWEPLRDVTFYTKVFHEENLDKEFKSIMDGTALKVWIFKKGDSTKTIGSIGFSNIIRGVFLSCHLGYKLDYAEINQGYMTEAIQKGIDIIFNNYELHRIEANILPRNKRSLRVVEKLGFQHEGLARDYLLINGKWEDHIHMVLLNDNL